jgi:hypothetical protein
MLLMAARAAAVNSLLSGLSSGSGASLSLPSVLLLLLLLLLSVCTSSVPVSAVAAVAVAAAAVDMMIYRPGDSTAPTCKSKSDAECLTVCKQ